MDGFGFGNWRYPQLRGLTTSVSESHRLCVPHDRPGREHNCGSRKMPQSRVPRGLPHLPVCDVCLQYDRGNGADTLSHHPYQVSLDPGTRKARLTFRPPRPHLVLVCSSLGGPNFRCGMSLTSQLPQVDRNQLHLIETGKRGPREMILSYPPKNRSCRRF